MSLPTWTMLEGDCRLVMAEMAPESVHLVCTSPPYFGLRDYGTAQWDGGDEACDHKPPHRPYGEKRSSTLDGGRRDGMSSTMPLDAYQMPQEARKPADAPSDPQPAADDCEQDRCDCPDCLDALAEQAQAGRWAY